MRRKGKGTGESENDPSHNHDHSPNHPAEKRRRITKSSRTSDILPSPTKGSQPGSSISPSGAHSRHSAPLGPPPHPRNTLAPIKPIGFAASRESRREDGADHAIPSPVVMGFDFKQIDEDQLKTVRDMISIKEQQQALIAQRRKKVTPSTPSTPKELTFKGWTPKDPEKEQGVGRRREKTRDKVETLSIVTSATDKDVVPGSKSAPLNQGLTTQQASPREVPSGSQTALLPHILPPIHGYPPNGMSDPRTAPISHTRTRTDDHEFARQQQPYYHRHRYPEQSPHTAVQPTTANRRNFTMQSLQPPSGAPHPHGTHSHSPSSPPIHRRETFLQPFNQLYDLLAHHDALHFPLQDLLHRYEGVYSAQLGAMGEFKDTAARASTVLENLQASADSLKEMVRYEVERAGSADRRENEELKERMKRLEERLDKQA